MRIEDIVEALNKCISEARHKSHNDAKSFLILKKSVLPMNTFKAYKEFNYEIFLVNESNLSKIVSYRTAHRVTSDAELEVCKNECEKELCANLFNWVHSYSYDQVVNNTYERLEE